MDTSKTASAFRFLSSARLRAAAFGRAHSCWNVVIKFGLLWLLFYLVAFRRLDPDFGWHLQAGNYIRAHGIPAHDIFTYTARQFPWIDHEWGNDVIVSLLYGWGGYGLVSLAYGAVWAGALLLAGRRLRLWVLALAALAVVPYAGIRPVMWTVLLLAITLRLLRSRRARLVWLLPPLFIIWANLHAGFVSGLGVIAYTAVYKRRPKLLLVFVLCTLATFINAYGPRLYVEVGRTLFDSQLHSQVGEWAPFSFPAASLLFIAVWGAGSALFDGKPLTRWARPSVLLLLSAASATRNVPLFVVAAAGELNGYVAGIRQRLPERISRTGKYWAAGMAAIGLLAVLYCAYLTLWPLRTPRLAPYPVAAVAYLRTHGCAGGQLFNDYDYGGYLIWQLPSQPVYIDGRMPVWRDPSGQEYLTKYYGFLAQPQSYHQVYQKYNIRCSLLGKNQRNIKLINLLERNHWRTAVETPYSILQVAPW